MPHGEEVSEVLLANDVLVDYRPNAGIRIAPHFYTSDDELERAVGMIEDAITTGEWQAYAKSGAAARRG